MTQPYDNRDAFPLSIVRVPYLDRNILSEIDYVSIGSEILRFVETTLEINTFVKLSNHLLREYANKEVNIDP